MARIKWKSDPVIRSGNIIKVEQRKLNFNCFLGLNKHLYHATEKKRLKSVIVDLSYVTKIFPESISPLVALTNKYRRSEIKIDIIMPLDKDANTLFKRIGYEKALTSGEASGNDIQVFDNAEQLNSIISKTILKISGYQKFSPSEISVIEWAINEVTDNVLNHGKSGGVISTSYFPNENILSCCIADCGKTIPITMRKRFSGTDENLILKSLDREITSDPELGQGNGLAGLLELINATKGQLFVFSRNGYLTFEKKKLKTKNSSVPFQGTSVSFQINLDRIPTTILDSRPSSHFEIASIDSNSYRIVLSEQAENFGNRKTGLKIRNLIGTALDAIENSTIIIDFQGLTGMSSSCADEIFGKLCLDIGVLKFSFQIKFENLNGFLFGIIDKAIMQRLQN